MTTEGEVEENKKCRLYKSWMLNRKIGLYIADEPIRVRRGSKGVYSVRRPRFLPKSLFPESLFLPGFVHVFRSK